MHHARGLIRQASRHAFAALESREASHDTASCFTSVSFIDMYGNRAPATLLLPQSLLKVLEDLPSKDALEQLRWAIAHTSQANPPSRNTDPLLFVKSDVAHVCVEVQRRQLRLLWKLSGKRMARQRGDAETFVRALLAKQAGGIRFDENDAAAYHGLVEELCRGDHAAALALAMNTRLPPLNTTTASCLARLVDIRSPTAVRAFMDGFAAKDDAVSAAETCATQLATRLRSSLSNPSEGASPSSPAASAATVLQACGLFNMDPGVVFPTNAAAIQQWGSSYISEKMSPAQRAEAVLKVIRQRWPQPRRISMDALSIWTLSDLGRPWLAELVADEASARRNASPREDTTARTVGDVARLTAIGLVLKDPLRNLIDNRLLHTYADLLRRGELSPHHESFPKFLEECGECHGDDRPAHLTLVLPQWEDPNQTVAEALRALAPRCAYWTTLLTHLPNRVAVFAAPCATLRVEVDLPSVHESVQAAASHAEKKDEAVAGAKDLKLIYEDDALLVLNKPPGLATSRHALSCTQYLGQQVTDVISIMLCRAMPPETLSEVPAAASRPPNSAFAAVFRQGQVHRLDVDTSGCLLMAKSPAAADSLRHQMGTTAAFSRHTKLYEALCVVLEPNLSRVPLKGRLTDPQDAKIKTHYRIVRFFSKSRLALVECRLHQGKKHQIRRHLASRGLPIVGDVEHGGAVCCRPLISRVALHAKGITFVHPTTGAGVTVVAPTPSDFRKALQLLHEGERKQ